MKTEIIFKTETHRRLCLQKDIKEVVYWINTFECFNTELDHFNTIEKQLMRNSISGTIQAIRRKNILNMALFCKYEQELKVEHEYGKVEYDLTRTKLHEQKRAIYLKSIEDFNVFKNQFYVLLSKYHRK